jgi:hypothetical protein
MCPHAQTKPPLNRLRIDPHGVAPHCAADSPKIGAAPELLVFYCRECNEVDSASWRPGPSQSTIALN